MCFKYERKQMACHNQETLFSQATRSAALSCMRRCAVSSNWHVYLCLDGVTQYTLDCTHCRTVGQLQCFLYPESSSSFYVEGVHEWGHGHLPSNVPVPRRLVRLSRPHKDRFPLTDVNQLQYICIFCPSRAELIPYVIYARPLLTLRAYPYLGLCRSAGNSMALVFPLFTQQMFAALTYKWALTLFAILALVMAPTPFVRPSPLFIPPGPCSCALRG